MFTQSIVGNINGRRFIRMQFWKRKIASLKRALTARFYSVNAGKLFGRRENSGYKIFLELIKPEVIFPDSRKLPLQQSFKRKRVKLYSEFESSMHLHRNIHELRTVCLFTRRTTPIRHKTVETD